MLLNSYTTSTTVKFNFISLVSTSKPLDAATLSTELNTMPKTALWCIHSYCTHALFCIVLPPEDFHMPKCQNVSNSYTKFTNWVPRSYWRA